MNGHQKYEEKIKSSLKLAHWAQNFNEVNQIFEKVMLLLEKVRNRMCRQIVDSNILQLHIGC